MPCHNRFFRSLSKLKNVCFVTSVGPNIRRVEEEKKYKIVGTRRKAVGLAVDFAVDREGIDGFSEETREKRF